MTGPESPSDGAWGWCSDPAQAPEIGRFFVAQAQVSYISHSELQYGRATSLDRWSETIGVQVEEDARRAIARHLAGTEGGMACALAMDEGRIAGLAFVRFVTDTIRAFAVLEDLLIGAERRGGGFGQRFVAWFAVECARRGCGRIFLESGLSNHQAHHFFERHGFRQTSVVMMRDVSHSDALVV